MNAVTAEVLYILFHISYAVLLLLRLGGWVARIPPPQYAIRNTLCVLRDLERLLDHLFTLLWR